MDANIKAAPPLARDANAFLQQLLRGSAKQLPIPSSMMQSDVPMILRDLSNYVVAPKDDGVRAVLLLGCTAATGAPYAVFVHRNGDVYDAPVQTEDFNHYAGTLIDGEVMEATFQCFDMYTISGYQLAHYSFESRRRLLQKTVPQLSSVGTLPLNFIFKPFHAVTPTSIRWCASRPNTDGIIVQHALDKLTLGRQRRTFKIKPTALNTVDLFVEPNQALRAQDRVVSFLKVHPSIGALVPGLYEFQISHNDLGWVAHSPQERTDKNVANSHFVVERTRQNITEGLDPQAFGAAVVGHQEFEKRQLERRDGVD